MTGTILCSLTPSSGRLSIGRSRMRTRTPRRFFARTTTGIRRFLTAGTVALIFAAAGCGGGASAPVEQAASPQGRAETVEECVSYERALGKCFHRNVSFAAQASLLPKNDSDRDRIRALCSENLRRLSTACR